MANDAAVLTANIVSLASEYGRYGYRRITALLTADGWRVNHKGVERIWRRGAEGARQTSQARSAVAQ
ncbi:MAG TPA: transposase [Candidatus Handelsmanbacteria bacterium]|nr:transposase [Candidatus Handelsmanbacteria bacterium]